MLACLPVLAQEAIKGVVQDANGKPVAAATVNVKGQKTSTSSAEDGSFTIRAKAGDVLVVSSIGFESSEYKVGRNAAPVIKLLSRADALNDIVVVGYGSVRKKDVTGSVAVVNHTYGSRKVQLNRTLRNCESIFGILDSTTNDRVDVDVEVGVLG